MDFVDLPTFMSTNTYFESKNIGFTSVCFREPIVQRKNNKNIPVRSNSPKIRQQVRILRRHQVRYQAVGTEWPLVLLLLWAALAWFQYSLPA